MSARPKPEPLVVVDGRYLLPQSLAAQMMAVLLSARRVEYSWSTKSFAFSNTYNNDGYLARPLTPAEEAALMMSEAEQSNS